MGVMLVKTLKSASKARPPWSMKTREAWDRYFETWSHLVASVEIVRNQRLEKLYFIIPEHLLESRNHPAIVESSQRFMLDVYSGDHAQKIRRYHTEGDLLLEEMKYVAGLESAGWLYAVCRREVLWINLTYSFSIVLTCLMAFNNMIRGGGDSGTAASSSIWLS